MFLVFEAEEDGLLGAFHYVANPIVPLDKTVAVLNMDMIGRDEDSPTWNTRAADNVNGVNLIGTLYSPDMRKVVEAENRAIGLKLDYKTDADDREGWFSRSDHYPFAVKGVPVAFFNTGEHPDYHTANDTWDRINYPKMEKIVRLVYLSTRSLANSPSRPRFVTGSGTPVRSTDDQIDERPPVVGSGQPTDTRYTRPCGMEAVMSSSLVRLLSFAVAAVLLVPAAGLAQVSSGKILGAVQDESAGALPGVTIVVRNVETGVSRETVTNTRGRFEVPGLQPGRYQVEAELTGFSRYSQGPVAVQVNEETLVNINLKVGQLSETINVVAQSSIVQTTTATLGKVIEEKQILELPLSGRNFTSLGLLTPGVTTRGQSTTDAAYVVHGQRQDSNNFQLDGVANVSLGGNTVQARPNVDAVQEFKIQTSNFSAEFGRNSGSVVQVVTKSGTNSVRGSVVGVPARRQVPGAELLRHVRAAAAPAESVRRDRSAARSRFPASTPAATGPSSSAPTKASG